MNMKQWMCDNGITDEMAADAYDRDPEARAALTETTGDICVECGGETCPADMKDGRCPGCRIEHEQVMDEIRWDGAEA